MDGYSTYNALDTIAFVARNAANQVYNTLTGTYEPFDAAKWGQYLIPTTGDGSGEYEADAPAGAVRYAMYRVGASYATSAIRARGDIAPPQVTPATAAQIVEELERDDGLLAQTNVSAGQAARFDQIPTPQQITDLLERTEGPLALVQEGVGNVETFLGEQPTMEQIADTVVAKPEIALALKGVQKQGGLVTYINPDGTPFATQTVAQSGQSVTAGAVEIV
jgi:hypothetical protein